MKSLARMLRRHSTDAERLLWYYLRAHRMGGYKFKRQAIIASHIVDFVCFEAYLIIEADGGHHGERIEEDRQRTVLLNSKGFRVIRFWNHEILFDTRNVLREIYGELLNAPSPQPSPSRRERGRYS
jgi:very-short-patch-repair endonuclease